jgi:hypothetical protein
MRYRYFLQTYVISFGMGLFFPLSLLFRFKNGFVVIGGNWNIPYGPGSLINPGAPG